MCCGNKKKPEKKVEVVSRPALPTNTVPKSTIQFTAEDFEAKPFT